MILIQKSKFIADEKYLTKLISLLLFIGDKFSFVNKCHIVSTYESVNGRNVLIKFRKLLLVTDPFPFFNVFFSLSYFWKRMRADFEFSNICIKSENHYVDKCFHLDLRTAERAAELNKSDISEEGSQWFGQFS